MNTKRSYGEFYALLNQMPGALDGLKEELVEMFTNGRTNSLREMTDKEYSLMCSSMREVAHKGMSDERHKIELKSRRSAVLHRMQKLGVDTTNWSNVDHFCLQPRIAGKRFVRLTVEELSAMIPKLESMLQKKEESMAQMPDELLWFDTVKLN